MAVRRTLLGLASFSVPGALLSTGILLSYGYASQLVYTIGDTRQLTLLFLGVIVGSVVFSLAGYLTRPSPVALAVGTVVASLALVATYAAMATESFVLDGATTFVVSLAMTSALVPVGTSLRLGRKEPSFAARGVFGAVQALLTILLVFVYAFYYEVNGQLDFYVGPVVMLTLSLVALLFLLRAE